MAFITLYDLHNTYSEDQVAILLESIDNVDKVINRAVAKAKGYIQHRYNPDEVFLNVSTFNTTDTFAVGSLIIYFETEWDTADTYALNARISYREQVNGKWVDKIYKSLQGSNTAQNPSTATAYWEYVVDNNTHYVSIAETTGFYPENVTYWTAGDTRDESIVEIVSWLTLYRLASSNNPRTIQEIVVDNMNMALDDLKAYQKGTRMVVLPVRLDDDGEQEGHRISFDSSTQKDWDY